MLAMHVPNRGIHTLYPKFTFVFFSTGKYRKRLFVCGRGVKVELLKTLRFVLCSFPFGIHTMHGE